jgi:hypothetical protein
MYILLLLLQDDWAAASREFDNFGRASNADRRATIQKLAGFDTKDSAGKLVRAFDILEKDLDKLIPEKDRLWEEMLKIPPIEGARPSNFQNLAKDPNYHKSVKQWTEFWAKEKQVQDKIVELESVREAVIAALAGFKSAETIEFLAGKLKTAPDSADREGIAEAFAAVSNDLVVPALVDRVEGDRDWRVRVVAIDSLATRKATEAIDPIAAALKGPEWQVKIAAVNALDKFADKRAVPALIDALASADGRVKHEINALLVKLTGVDKHGDPATWKGWWEENKSAFGSPEYKPPAAPPESKDAKGTTFYGIPIVSKRVVFIIDRSGSMEEPSDWKPEGTIGTGGGPVDNDKPEGTRKIDIAKFELRRAVRGLPEDTLFTIVAFSDGVLYWKETLEPANKKNKEDALGWVAKMDPSGGTNSHDALQAGFGVKGPPRDREKSAGGDTIYFMSDGRPSVGPTTDTAQIRGKVKEWNETRKIKIHGIAVGKEDLQRTEGGGGVDPDFIKGLAEDSGGSFVWRK